MDNRLPGRTSSAEPRRRAFTLVEALLAISIGAALTGAAATIAVQSQRGSRAVRARLDGPWARQQVLRQFAYDVEQRITWLPERMKTLEVRGDDQELFTVIALSEIADSSAITRRRLPARIRWLAKRDPDAATYSLVREVHDLTRAGSRSQQALSSGLGELRIEIYASGEWWPTAGSGPESVPPGETWAAIRLTASWAEESGRAPHRRTVLLHDGTAEPRKNS